MIVPAKVFGGAPPSTEDKMKQRDTIFDEKRGILKVINNQLEKTNTYFCGDHLTVVDLLIYCEIATIFALT
jgi:glutathione S-transferase